jgi:peptidoglycan/LPS O-acetylase OafA/YrhL
MYPDYPIYPYFLLMAALTVCFSTRLWRFVDGVPARSGARIESIDGMRGYLALSVMVHHAVIARAWLATGSWVLPTDPFYAQLGSVAVSLFFMITGYLFWGKLVAKEGRADWMGLYIGRLFRIAPLYWLTIAIMTLLVFVRSDFELRQAPGALAAELWRWCRLGMFPGHDFNGYPNVWILIAGVTWTLKYEWRFYFALLPLSVFAKPRFHLPAAALACVIAWAAAAITQFNGWGYTALFSAGMLSASLSVALKGGLPNASRLRFPLSPSMASTLVAILLVVTFVISPRPFGVLQVSLLALVFFLVCQGATLFGLFTSRAAVRLGHISYGIYLMQGLVISVIFDHPVTRQWVARNESAFWWLTLAVALALCAVAAIVHVLLERPSIDLGRRCASAVKNRVAKRREQLSMN